MGIRLVVGLGNPGPRYANTRHNVGFQLLDRLKGNSSWHPWKELGLGEYGKADSSAGVYLIRPLTYMNLSGRMVQSFAHFYKIKPEDVLVCYDDIDLPLGRLRMRLKGSSGGHRGMESVIDMLGTRNIPRLRVGIGPVPPHMDPTDFVLKPMSAQEGAVLDGVLAAATDAVMDACERGVEAAMNKHNPAEPKA